MKLFKAIRRPAFTLIETILAVSLVTVVFAGICGLILSTLQAGQNNFRRVQATALAQEGLELMRYVRDSNWLQNYTWNGGASLWGQDFILTDANPEKTLWIRSTNTPPFLTLTTDPSDSTLELGGFSFERSVQVKAVSSGLSIDEDQVELSSTVRWRERGREQTVTLSTFLTNWK